MTRNTDTELLQEFAERGDQRAFAALVERHLPLVYSAARRKVGDAGLAQDVAQQVFTLLARKADELRPGIILSGWLYRTACHLAGHAVRAEMRRVAREQVAAAQMIDETPDSLWRDIEGELDEAMETLGEDDRDAVLLRYFENKSLREVGAAMGTSDDAAQKRLSRAVEKLRAYFHGRGRPVGAAALTAAIAAGAVLPAPTAAAAAISSVALGSATAVSAAFLSTTTTTSTLIMSSLLKPAILGVAGVAAAAGLVIQQHQLSVERDRVATLAAQVAALDAASPPNAGGVRETSLVSQAEKAELLRLRAEVGRLRGEMARARATGRHDGRAIDVPAAEETAVNTGKSASAPIDPMAVQERVEALKVIGLGLRVLNTDAETDPELRKLKFTPGQPLPAKLLEIMGPKAASLDQVELLVPDVDWMLKAERMPESIIARSREVTPTGDGRFVRVYALGDGSVQSVRHATAEEAYGWGQRADGQPVDWGQLEGGAGLDPVLAERYGLKATPTSSGAKSDGTSAPKVFKMDPELARRYGLSPSGK